MHAKPSFAHRLKTAKMASSLTSAQNNGSWVQSLLLEHKMFMRGLCGFYNDDRCWVRLTLWLWSGKARKCQGNKFGHGNRKMSGNFNVGQGKIKCERICNLKKKLFCIEKNIWWILGIVKFSNEIKFKVRDSHVKISGFLCRICPWVVCWS